MLNHNILIPTIHIALFEIRQLHKFTGETLFSLNISELSLDMNNILSELSGFGRLFIGWFIRSLQQSGVLRLMLCAIYYHFSLPAAALKREKCRTRFSLQSHSNK